MKIISAPFGNYLSFRGWTATLGTFTPKYRGGLLKRLWRCALTLRYDREYKGWVNRLGLPNPGIYRGLVKNKVDLRGKIVSIGVGTGDGVSDWEKLLSWCKALDDREPPPRPLAWEINVSCPNCEMGLTTDSMIRIAAEARLKASVFIKIPPVWYESMVKTALEHGFSKFHCCNTIPVSRGGLSGPSLRPYVKGAIKFVRKKYGPAEIIAGGGIQCQQDVREYMLAGADHVAVGSAWLNPLNWNRLRRITDAKTCQDWREE